MRRIAPDNQLKDSSPWGKNITYTINITENLIDVTRCNTLHRENCQEFI